ncbi:co-chaperone protein HscB [Formosimonas limnophila]|uniref:Co-chaperone protein HscB homolog n=1 Tax=Formosimonas limnophila TaxID=1384487 RepID=A0A8J3CM30_9BURK|nr:Fe-S protein assembly co-chaperone HscB [Formosimonas limnophila]GHA64784.1 co-chaperone protein HscB [Formosimonas limnophila]
MKQNYFELFQLPIGFAINEADLALRHRAIIDKVHPDRFAAKSPMEQRLALQWSTFANEAFDTLRDPIARAKYLLQLYAPELTGESVRVTLPQNFLMQQMEWREALEDGNLDAVRDEVYAAQVTALADLSTACAAQDWNAAQIHIAQSQFIDNFLKQLPYTDQ